MPEDVGMARRRRRSAAQAQDVLAGLPQTTNGAFTPPGQIEQWGKIAQNMSVRKHGWKHVITGIGWVLVAIPVALIIVLTLLHH
jgi:hypothetical protein